jgi:hypothetical protein
MSRKRVAIIGLHPSVVNYEKWPQLTPEKLEGALSADASTLNELGYDASIIFVDHGETAEEVVTRALSDTNYDCILIGAGVRTDPDEFLLFEKLVNLVHKRAPQACLCFNTSPTDTAAAIQRWI